MTKPHTFGKICEKHSSLKGERYNYQCIACRKEQNAAREQRPEIRAIRRSYREKNKVACNARSKEGKRKNAARNAIYNKGWYRAHKAKNPELYKNRDRAQYAKRKEYFAQKYKRWVATNPEKRKAFRKHHETIRRRLIGGQALARAHRKETLLIYQACPPGHHVDHIVPLKGKTVIGLHVPWNLQYLPARENMSKGNRHWPEAAHG